MKKIFFFLLLFPVVLATSAQNNLYLNNPSFEDYPRPAKPPKGWVDCGFKGETPPDVQPDATFSVTKKAQEGETYLLLAVRDNDTWESVTQELKQPLEKDSTYEFKVHLSLTDTYISVSRITEETMQYTTPAIFRLWVGNEDCKRSQLIGETRAITHDEWKAYPFIFRADADWKYLILEAYFDPNKLFPYCGNLTLDNSSLVLINTY